MPRRTGSRSIRKNNFYGSRNLMRTITAVCSSSARWTAICTSRLAMGEAVAIQMAMVRMVTICSEPSYGSMCIHRIQPMRTTSRWITLSEITKMYVTKFMPWVCGTLGVFRLIDRRGSFGPRMWGRTDSKRSISLRPAAIMAGARSKGRSAMRDVQQPCLTRVLSHQSTNMAAPRVVRSPADTFIGVLGCLRSSARTYMATLFRVPFGVWGMVDRACSLTPASERLCSSHPSVRGTMENCF